MWLWLVGALLLLLDFHLLLLLLHITIIQTISFAEEVAAPPQQPTALRTTIVATYVMTGNLITGGRERGRQLPSSQGDDVRSCTFSFSRYTREEIYL